MARHSVIDAGADSGVIFDSACYPRICKRRKETQGVSVDGTTRRRSESQELRIDALAARILELDPRSNVTPALDRVIYDALQLSFVDLERLIERLTAERGERWKKIIKKSE